MGISRQPPGGGVTDGELDEHWPTSTLGSSNNPCYLLQQLNESVYGSSRFRRAGHMHVEFITVRQCIQTENKHHIVLEQTGLWREETRWAAHDHINQ